MKVTIDIPAEYEKHFKNDQFKDSLERIKTDCTEMDDTALTWNYDLEVLEMLIDAFQNAEPLICAKWIDRYFGDRCGNCGYEISRTSSQYRCDYCPKCGRKMNGVIKINKG